MTLLEKEIEAMLRRYVHAMGGLFYKFVSPGNNGVPDRIAVLPGGRIWFIELKSDTGTPAALQEWQVEQLRKRGANAVFIQGKQEAVDWCVARGIEWDQVKKAREEEGGDAR